jgi:hypothetical protein
LGDSVAVGVHFVFFYFVCEKPVHLIACYGVVKIVEAPEKVNYALWAQENTLPAKGLIVADDSSRRSLGL